MTISVSTEIPYMVFRSKEAPEYMEELIDQIDGNIQLNNHIPAHKMRKYKIHPKPFAKGAERLCFLAFDTYDKKLQVKACYWALIH